MAEWSQSRKKNQLKMRRETAVLWNKKLLDASSNKKPVRVSISIYNIVSSLEGWTEKKSGVSGAEKAFCFSLPASSLTVMLTMTHLSSKPCTPLFNCSKAEAVSEAAKKEKSREVKGTE